MLCQFQWMIRSMWRTRSGNPHRRRENLEHAVFALNPNQSYSSGEMGRLIVCFDTFAEEKGNEPLERVRPDHLSFHIADFSPLHRLNRLNQSSFSSRPTHETSPTHPNVRLRLPFQTLEHNRTPKTETTEASISRDMGARQQIDWIPTSTLQIRAPQCNPRRLVC